MKYLIVCLLVLSVFQTRPSDAFISSLISGLTNIVSNGIDSVTSTINTVTQVGQFLWDNAVAPSLTVLQQSNDEDLNSFFSGFGKIFKFNFYFLPFFIFIKTASISLITILVIY